MASKEISWTIIHMKKLCVHNNRVQACPREYLKKTNAIMKGPLILNEHSHKNRPFSKSILGQFRSKVRLFLVLCTSISNEQQVTKISIGSLLMDVNYTDVMLSNCYFLVCTQSSCTNCCLLKHKSWPLLSYSYVSFCEMDAY